MGKNWAAILPSCALCIVTVLSACSSATSEETKIDSVPTAETEEGEASPVPEPTAVEESEPQEMSEQESMEDNDEEYEVRFRFPNEWVPADGLGEGILQPLGDSALPEGFVEEEYLFSGEAVSYVPEGPVGTAVSYTHLTLPTIYSV